MTAQHPSLIPQAFVLGAGLGTRLKPLTETLPKPLVPVLGRPLICSAFDHLIGAGVERFIVNTHHRAEAYTYAFPAGEYRGCPIAFRHEPLLLETGGGLKNIEDLTEDANAPLLVYNGDIYATLPLSPAIEHHLASGHEVTLILRSRGGATNVGFQATGEHDDHRVGVLTDLRHRLERDPGAYLFTGIYLVSPAFFHRLKLEKISVVEPLLEMISQGIPVGAIVIDAGEWRDLGTREQLLALHSHLKSSCTEGWISDSAEISPEAQILGASVVAHGAKIGKGAILQDSIVWENAVIEPGAELTRCIVTGKVPVSGRHLDEDL